MRILITGAAGFIGAHLSARLEIDGHECVFVDRLSDYYSEDLKKVRFKNLVGGELRRINIHDPEFGSLFGDNTFDCVIHLAAQPGVRVGFPKNLAYYKDNIEAFSIVSRFAIEAGVKKVIYASSSSVYEKAQIIQFREEEVLKTPDNPYPFSKWINEQMAGSFSKISDTKFTGLRFFSVYGPWGRPDMAYYRLIAAASDHYHFTLNGSGHVKRDFTFIDDVTSRINLLVNADHPLPDILNIGGGNEVSILQLIKLVGEEFGETIEFQSGESNLADLALTKSDSARIDSLTQNMPFTEVKVGIGKTINWYRAASSEFNVREWLE